MSQAAVSQSPRAEPLNDTSPQDAGITVSEAERMVIDPPSSEGSTTPRESVNLAPAPEPINLSGTTNRPASQGSNARTFSAGTAKCNRSRMGRIHILDMDRLMIGNLAEAEEKPLGTCTRCHTIEELADNFPVSEDEDAYLANIDESGNFIETPRDSTDGISSSANTNTKQKQQIHILNRKLFKEREAILAEATRLGESRGPNYIPRHILVVFNPISGGGAAKRLVSHIVLPVLERTRTDYTVQATEYKRHAVQLMRDLDPEMYDGIIVAGGDGLVHEVITGYFTHRNQKAIRKVPIGIVPSGTANAMATALHKRESKSQVALVGYSALAVAKGLTTNVDVISFERLDMDTEEERKVFALSCFGWGIAGAVALKADKLRWIPGQKKARYDIAGAVSLLSDWPIVDEFDFSYPVSENEWATERLRTINLIASNMPYLGSDNAIYPHIEPDDGNLAVVTVADTCSRMEVIRMSMGMKKGIYLGEQRKHVQTYILSEFKITPVKAKAPFLIDGDPHAYGPAHVRVLKQALQLFVLPAQGIEDNLSTKVGNAPTAVAMSVAGVDPHHLGLRAQSSHSGSPTPTPSASASQTASRLSSVQASNQNSMQSKQGESALSQLMRQEAAK
ncbi:uncharacterized protein MONBRDRAFT_32642 [Monosiga brevicollis MX1]|uniref:DAGKc domain-containing protein n=1 Tax=Monosiga brevicollis TaxID=81824 RepID=A9V0V4_MONBE|nr:uncharacterized protein MONBRDRAFT_32642 [Monosiga brevicollis MX1]EDQ88820.1 predicted protein [Monosiga brevicollis MX1]|eukprot:XP_001746433.1 hypothetical protein [Monosiga brevicollis MX1]